MGVGRELVDHPLGAVDLPAHLPVAPGPKYQVMLTARSSLADPSAAPDLHLFPAGPFSAEDYSPTRAVQAIVMSVVKPRSHGWVRLRSANPADSPRIHLGLLEHPEDVARMIEAVRIARRIARHPAMRELIAGPELAPGEATDDQDEAGMERALKSRVETYHHPVGSCRMGPDPAAGAVVDTYARVHGLEGLRVIDASVLPEIPSANTNIPTLMLAERVADMIRRETVV
jgi:choline dehydrogenase